MKKYIWLLIFASMFIVGCTETNNKTTKQKISAQNRVEKAKELNNPPVYLDSLKTTDQILQHITKRTTDIKTILTTSSPDAADKIYDNFKKENDSAMVLLMQKNQKFLEDFYQYIEYDDKTEITTLKIPDSLKPKVAKFEKAGVEFWDVGEAITELRMNPDFYFRLFNGKITPDYQRYLEIITEEDKVLFQADASISIPWPDVARRIEVREDFFREFKESQLLPKVRKDLAFYRYAYLLGFDNTPTFNNGPSDDSSTTFLSENIKEFQRFMKAHPDSETTKMIREMLVKSFKRDEIYEWATAKTNFSW